MHWDLRDQAKRINVILRGHFSYYGMAGNARRLHGFRYEVERSWRRHFSRRSQKGQISWTKMKEILALHRLERPKVRIGYGDL